MSEDFIELGIEEPADLYRPRPIVAELERVEDLDSEWLRRAYYSNLTGALRVRNSDRRGASELPYRQLLAAIVTRRRHDPPMIAELLDVSTRTVERDLAELDRIALSRAVSPSKALEDTAPTPSPPRASASTKRREDLRHHLRLDACLARPDFARLHPISAQHTTLIYADLRRFR